MYDEHMSMERVYARARFASLGGVVLAGIAFLFLVFFWYAFVDPSTPMWLKIIFGAIGILFVLYLLDVGTERLELRETEMIFDSALHHPRRVDVCRFPEILLVHEGMNQQKGIVSVICRGLDEETRLSLGPLWRARDLESFFVAAAERTGKCKLVGKDL